ncbi:hypothetical protein J6590_086994, partial [Homalodisca vitripennis]
MEIGHVVKHNHLDYYHGSLSLILVLLTTMTSFQWEMAVAAFHTIPSYTIGGYRDWMDTSSSWRS